MSAPRGLAGMPAVPPITLRADFTELPRLAAWTDAVLGGMALEARTDYAVRLCIEELVANLVMHAAPLATPSSGPIGITLRIDAAPLRLVIEDDAAPFDPTVLAAPLPEAVQAEAGLAGAATGGRGLPLVRRFCREWSYSSQDGMNRLELLF